MKKIYLLVIKAFIRPFFVTFFIVMFILLMLFLFKYIDDLIGKGFEWTVILELLWYASATNVAMALPLAMLLSSIMTFGSLGENYELVAIKSAGISLQKAMMPLVILVGGLSIGAFFFSNYMLPIASLKMGSLLYDVRNQKATFLIEEGVFNNSFPGYSIRVEKKDPDGQTLHNVVIYDHNTASGSNVLIAKEGRMYKTEDEQFLVLRLKDGIRYEESEGEKGYNPRERLLRYRFKETEQKFDLSGFKLQRTDESLFKSNYAMLNLKQLDYYKDSIKTQLDSTNRSTFNTIKRSFRVISSPSPRIENPKIKTEDFKKSVLELIPRTSRMSTISNARSVVNNLESNLTSLGAVTDDYKTRIRRYVIEYQRKFTLSVSCLILFSIGAPLGAIIRKGGLGLPVVMSIIFFLIYHIISTIGEKSAKEGSLSPVFGMWIAIIALAPLGMFLTYKATVDSSLFDLDYYKQLLFRFFKRKKK
ncbi:LptF/LptG family permease [Rubrolithibacter danxiaensis]|uniref:LptF/LptG family permease n=1 Tax=Rubrolithibacter danxiaensis TaxID=3390805 RepID=UPI003BF8C709